MTKQALRYLALARQSKRALGPILANLALLPATLFIGYAVGQLLAAIAASQ